MARPSEQAKAVAAVAVIAATAGVAWWAAFVRPGRYRVRTWLRGLLPYALSDRIPKGAKDCGNHEWYRQDEDTDACYHCDVGIRQHVQDVAEDPRDAPPPPRVPVFA